jgi:hypothetical protein
MKITDTLEYQNIIVNLKASMLEQDIYMAWSAKFEDMDTADMPHFISFMFIASAIDTIEGLDWTRPLSTIDEKGMRASYKSFMGQINMGFFNALRIKVDGLVMPTADEVEMPDRALDDDQKKT